MHKYRRQAKFAAWYDEPDESSSSIVNPFAKWRPATRANTLEASGENASPLRITQTDDPRHYRSSSGLSHHGDWYGEGPSHADTSPTAYHSRAEHEIPRTSSPVNYHSEPEKDQDANPESSDPAPTQETGLKEQDGRTRPSSTTIQQSGLKRLFAKGEDAQESDDDEGKKDAQRFSTWSQIRATVFNSWINVLFALVPVGFALNYANVDAAAVFAINFVAIIPSTRMISFAVEEITFRLGELQGALLSITFSNATQLISSILLLKHKQMTILKTSLLGSIISNLLFMTGLCFFFGGINRIEQAFNVTVAQTVSMMLLLAVISLVVPTASRLMVSGVTDHDIVVQSRGTSVIILISYALYLFFQLRTHRRIFDTPCEKNARITKKLTHVVVPERFRKRSPGVSGGRPIEDIYEDEQEEEEEEQPSLSFITAFVTLVVSTVLVAFNAEFATGSVQKMVHQAGISQTFVGFVIFPLLSNDPESIFLAVKDKLYLSISLTLDKCMQVALLIVPLLVMVAWAMANEEMTLDFDGFPVAVSFASVIVVAYVVQEGKSNWLTGALLIKVYVIVALATYCIH
ncbi:hypothetical protein H2204_011220 [Knufia peltigerae]|uniref:Sodium/calcium exchanger membrane region domain-containing protein n=1 Tax=Knufia peltigerae TaxID=1002370 RepID=A0AA38XUL1_9EURO|nr:hypothetical protein H2204_011220 [Knufia peltigerae]